LHLYYILLYKVAENSSDRVKSATGELAVGEFDTAERIVYSGNTKKKVGVKMKKIISTVLVAGVLIALVGCAGHIGPFEAEQVLPEAEVNIASEIIEKIHSSKAEPEEPSMLPSEDDTAITSSDASLAQEETSYLPNLQRKIRLRHRLLFLWIKLLLQSR